MPKTYLVKSPEDFLVIIEEILDWAKANDKNNLVLALDGELGAGKTAFTKKLGEKLGVTENINSPTFTIMSSYQTQHPTFSSLVHIDAYRLESAAELKPLHIEEVFKQPNTMVCVEWASNIKSVVPDEAVSLDIYIAEGETREVRVEFGR